MLSTSHATSKFSLLHFYVWVLISTLLIHGHKYFLTIVDDFSRFIWIILMEVKYEVVMHVQNFVNMVENQHKTTPQIISTKNLPFYSFYNTKAFNTKCLILKTPKKWESEEKTSTYFEC